MNRITKTILGSALAIGGWVVYMKGLYMISEGVFDVEMN